MYFLGTSNPKDDYVQPPPITSLLILKALPAGVFMVASNQQPLCFAHDPARKYNIQPNATSALWLIQMQSALLHREQIKGKNWAMA